MCPSRPDDQLDLQSLHRVREGWVVNRTAVINQIRGILLDRGITVPKGRRRVDESLPWILEGQQAVIGFVLANRVSRILRVGGNDDFLRSSGVSAPSAYHALRGFEIA